MNKKTIALLVKLRYRLLWAQARTRNGKVALFFILYLLGISVAVFLGLGGIGTAVALAKLGRGEQVARWILSALFLNALIAGIVLGIGPRHAFSESVLRRYPMTRMDRLAARHLIGLLDPMWLLMLALVLGLAFGFSLIYPWQILAGLPASILCVATCYIATASLLLMIDRMLQSRAGTLILGGLVLLLINAVAIPMQFLAASGAPGLKNVADHVLRYTPPGAAAALLAGAGIGTQVFSAVTLIGWGVLLVWAIAALERSSPAVRTESGSDLSWENQYDNVASLFGPTLGPLVAKSLRYHLRCNRVRFGLVMAVPMIVLFPRILTMVPRHTQVSADASFLITLVFFLVGAYSSTMVLAVNHFGFDGPGIRRYLIVPAPFSGALLAGSLASLLIGECVVLVSLILWMAMSGLSFDLRVPTMFFFSGNCGLFLMNACGLWTTTLSPRRCDFKGVFGNQLSLGGNVLMFLQIFLIVIPLNYALFAGDTGADSRQILEWWWLSPLFTLFFVTLYVVTVRLMGPVLKWRRERLIRLIAGERSG